MDTEYDHIQRKKLERQMDIIEKLKRQIRENENYIYSTTAMAVDQEAIAEIERLRAELAKVR